MDGKIEVKGLREFIQTLTKATEDKSGEKAVKEANVKTGLYVIKWAQMEADSKMEKSAAASLTPSKAMNAVRVTGGNQNVPYFAGANFGAYRNRIRLIKALTPRQGGQRRTRATMVRIGEDFNKVARRVEAQYVDTRGRTVARNQGQQVRLARTKSGDIKKIRGWNQFLPWKKGKDNFLYRSIKKHYDEIVEFYFYALAEANSKVFPD